MMYSIFDTCKLDAFKFDKYIENRMNPAKTIIIVKQPNQSKHETMHITWVYCKRE